MITGIEKLLRALFRLAAREEFVPRPRTQVPIIENERHMPVRPRWSRSGPMTRAELYEYFKARGELAKFYLLFPPTRG